jgi:hypothetical protein
MTRPNCYKIDSVLPVRAPIDWQSRFYLAVWGLVFLAVLGVWAWLLPLSMG